MARCYRLVRLVAAWLVDQAWPAGRGQRGLRGKAGAGRTWPVPARCLPGVVGLQSRGALPAQA